MKYYSHVLTALLFSTILLGCSRNKKTNTYAAEKQKLVTHLEHYDWEAPEKVLSLIEPNIYLSEGSYHKIGNSKYGGTPDLPASLAWPNYNEDPMVFFGQINLEKTAKLDLENLLPKTGMLYFFAHFNAPETEYGSAYDFQMEKEKYQVLYYDGPINQVSTSNFPRALPAEFHFKEEPIYMEVDFSIPNSYAIKLDQLGLSEKDKELYEQVLDEYEFCQGETILGTPCPMQDAIEIDWAYAYLQTKDYKDEAIKKQVQDLRPDFINLLNFGMWGRFETIGISDCYFGIRKGDLQNKDFSKAVFVMQGT